MSSKEHFTDVKIKAMKKEDRDFYDIFSRKTEKLLGPLNIGNLNQFLLDCHHNSREIDIEEFVKKPKEFVAKYPTEEDRDRAYKLMRKGYDV